MTTARNTDLAVLLKQQSIEHAVIIDDAFDLTFAECVDKQKLNAFSATVKSDKEALEELTKLEIKFDAVVKGEEEALKSLAAKREKYVRALPAVEALLISYFEQRDPLTALMRNLASLGVPAVPFG